MEMFMKKLWILILVLLSFTSQSARAEDGFFNLSKCDKSCQMRMLGAFGALFIVVGIPATYLIWKDVKSENLTKKRLQEEQQLKQEQKRAAIRQNRLERRAKQASERWEEFVAREKAAIKAEQGQSGAAEEYKGFRARMETGAPKDTVELRSEFWKLGKALNFPDGTIISDYYESLTKGEYKVYRQVQTRGGSPIGGGPVSLIVGMLAVPAAEKIFGTSAEAAMVNDNQEKELRKMIEHGHNAYNRMFGVKTEVPSQ
jgi:hypothetical protein